MVSSDDSRDAAEGVCAAHTKYCRGVCSDCGCCRKCAPPADCATPTRHLSSTIGRPKKDDKDASTRPAKRPNNNSRASKRGREDDESGSEYADDNDNIASDVTIDKNTARQTAVSITVEAGNKATKKDKLLAILDWLEIEEKKEDERRLSNDGFSGIRTNQKLLGIATRVIDKIVTGVCNLLVSDRVDIMYLKDCYKKPVLEFDNKRVLQALSKLTLQGARIPSTIAGSVLAAAMQRFDLKNLLEETGAIAEEQDNIVLQTNRKSMGKVKFASLRSTFWIIA